MVLADSRESRALDVAKNRTLLFADYIWLRLLKKRIHSQRNVYQSYAVFIGNERKR